MKRILQVLGAMALAVGGTALADPAPVFTELGTIDNTLATQELFRSGDFTDIFNFQVTGPGASFAAAVGSQGAPDPTFGVNVVSVALFDEAFNTLATDTDGSDGFSVLGTLASPGTYRFAVLGNTLPSGGLYYAGVLPAVTIPAVPEPGSLLLGVGGLAVLAFHWKKFKAAQA